MIPNQSSWRACEDSHVIVAARTAGFLTACSESGIAVDMEELIGAESLSQRYRFAASLAETLKKIVHDDACHLRLVAENQKDEIDLSSRQSSI